MISLNDRIEINPAICHGRPVVRGTRVMVSQILGALSGGDTIEDVLADYPSLSAEDLSAVPLCFGRQRSQRYFNHVEHVDRVE